MRRLRIATLGLLASALWPSQTPAVHAQSIACRAPEAVCALRDAVFPVSSFDPVGSAVRLEKDLLVTNRHIVADEVQAMVFLPDGSRVVGQVVPTDYPGDLVLLRVPGLPPGPVAVPAPFDDGDRLFTVGADIGLGEVRVYPPGNLLQAPAEGTSRARIHHTAYSQPGNSGGILSDEAGRFVGVATSGGTGRFEAIPSEEVVALRAASGPQKEAASRGIGRNYRDCVETLDFARQQGRNVPAPLAEKVAARCNATGNRQMIGDAGRALGQAGHFEESITLLSRAVAMDPHAVNARLSLVVSLHLARRYEDELPHIAWLMENLPNDAQVLRFGIQAGKWGGDEDLARRALALLERHHPQMAPVARDFLDNGPPAPARAPQ